jgi:prepilin-type N-terminal cleavage/methylation domain-containing protein
MKIKNISSERGFTIVELMIALSVVSTILVMSTVIMMRIGFLYTKGVNASNVQNASRNVTADISSAIQLSGGDPFSCPSGGCTGGSAYKAFCIDNVRYTFIVGKTLGHDGFTGADTPHVLWRDTMTQGGSCAPINLATATTDAVSNGDGYEMVPNHVRLNKFDVVETAPGSGIYNVTVWLAYGDDDLVNNSPLSCNSGNGSQFCAISKSSTTVIRRIE